MLERFLRFRVEVQAADFRFPVALGESDLHSLTSAFARFARSSGTAKLKAIPTPARNKVSSAVGCLSPAVVSDSFFITLTAANYGEARIMHHDKRVQSTRGQAKRGKGLVHAHDKPAFFTSSKLQTTAWCIVASWGRFGYMMTGHKPTFAKEHGS